MRTTLRAPFYISWLPVFGLVVAVSDAPGIASRPGLGLKLKRRQNWKY